MATRFIDKVNQASDIRGVPDAGGVGFVNGVLHVAAPGAAAGSVFPISVERLYAAPIFVDGNNGSDTANDGRSWNKPYLTMSKAFSVLESGGVIYLKGRIREQLTTPAGVFDVRVIGIAPNTRHPDAHTVNGGFSSCRWDAPASPTAATPLVKVQQQGWQFQNILFTGSSGDTVDCVQLFRDGGSGDDERDASHASFLGCRFQGGRYGIVDSGGCARVSIKGCEFLLFSNSGDRAITNVTGAGIGTLWGWVIDGNDFLANLTDIDISGAGPKITNNHFHLNGLGVTNTIAIDLTGGSEELVAKNYMYCASDEGSVVNARFVASSTPSWGPNYYTDIEEYGEPAE